MAEQMRVAVGVGGDLDEEQLTLAAQMGCSGVVVASPRVDGGSRGLRWEADDLLKVRERVERFGLRVEAIQHSRLDLFDSIRLGRPDRDEQLEDFKHAIRSMGRAGIPIFAYNWRPNRLYRTGRIATRGGAQVSAFDLERAGDEPLSFERDYGADEMWATFDYFVKAVMPVAEEAGVKLAHHPDDPPGPAIGGVARIFSSFEGFQRGMEIADSPNWGLLFCMGCWSEMGGDDYVQRGLRYFGERGKIFYVHFRDVQGTGDRFNEVFIGDGQVDLTAALRTLKEVGFTGCLIDDHAPHMLGDTGWAPRGRIYQTGYIMGLLRAVNDLT